jgi:hypothetical protein
MMLNKRFDQFVRDIVGEEQYFTLRNTNGYRLAMKQFDSTIKTGFRTVDDEDCYINFPLANLRDDPDNHIRANCLTLTG